MSLYADYLTERTNDEIIERDDGFITYRYIDSKTCYITDIYVIPDKRHEYVATMLADLVLDRARAKGCTELLGTVAPGAKGATTSLKVLLGYGMELKSASENLIVFRRGI